MFNPLITKTDLPAFSQIKPEHIEPALYEKIDSSRKSIAALLNSDQRFTWENLIQPLEQIKDELGELWGIVEHLNSVKDTPEYRLKHDAVLPKVTEFFIELKQQEGLYKAVLNLKSSKEFGAFEIGQKKVIENYLRDFALSGVSLSKEKKEKFKQLLEELAELKNKFEHNVLDATDHWFLLIEDVSRLKGLPEHTISQAKLEAQNKNQPGWRITLDYPCYYAIMSYAADRELRQEIYRAYNTLASDQSKIRDNDNGPLMVEQIKLKQALAKILEYPSYADYALVKKMIKQPTEVLSFLNDLIKPIKVLALQELEIIKEFAAKEYNITKIEPWDLRYLSERLLEQNFQFSEEELRSYFPESQVIQGLFGVAHKLFKITITEVEKVDVWDKKVRLFAIKDQQGNLIGRFYMDLYARPHKRKGAWCGTCKNRIKKQKEIQTPVTYVVANFRPALDSDKEPYLSHDEVVTLFHEFGHCLHFLFSKAEYPAIGPDHGVAWDAIELPSQLMEHWCWEEEGLTLLSKHANTHDPIPMELIKKLKNTKNFLIGIVMLRQLEFALFDFELHLNTNLQDYSTILQVLEKVRERTGLMKVPDYNRFQNTFSHIFAGDYSAGYYSYLWSEVLSADTYKFFKENNQVFDQAVAQRYLETILEPGGSQEFMDLFLEFRGRPPQVEALLQDWGLIPGNR